jgi:hypothetical protein
VKRIVDETTRTWMRNIVTSTWTMDMDEEHSDEYMDMDEEHSDEYMDDGHG